jgi:hypothetical protein
MKWYVYLDSAGRIDIAAAASRAGLVQWFGSSRFTILSEHSDFAEAELAAARDHAKRAAFGDNSGNLG